MTLNQAKDGEEHKQQQQQMRVEEDRKMPNAAY